MRPIFSLVLSCMPNAFILPHAPRMAYTYDAFESDYLRKDMRRLTPSCVTAGEVVIKKGSYGVD
ncbi:MAG: hypothetical protein KF806_00600 [Nitrospira sp.]|nr:hypothetical protein [Nitrospira sp.]